MVQKQYRSRTDFAQVSSLKFQAFSCVACDEYEGLLRLRVVVEWEDLHQMRLKQLV